MATSERRADSGVAALVLAGGRARRMGGADKGLLPLMGRPLIGWAIDRLAPQVDALVISANRNLNDYADLGLPVIPDRLPDQPGPLAGILAAGQATDGAEWLLAVPCDVPLLPADLVARLLDTARARQVPLVRAADAGRVHYAVMLLHRELLTDLATYLAAGGRQVQAWQARHPHAETMFGETEAFLNVNTADDLARAERLLAGSLPDR